LFLLQMQFVNLQIFLKTRLNIINLNWQIFLCFFVWLLPFFIAAAVCSHADCVIAHWLLSSAYK
jgi:hypothetical protein